MGLGEISLGEMGLGEMGLGEMGQNRNTVHLSQLITNSLRSVENYRAYIINFI